jgi:hypothetical protein
MGSNYTPINEMISGGQGLTGISQQQINDLVNRFYGNQQAPWQQAAEYMNLIGNPQTGSSTTTTPILGPNPTSSALGTLGSVASLGNNLGLFGGGAGAAGALGAGAAGDFVPTIFGSSVDAGTAASLAGSGLLAGGADASAAAAPLALGLTVICTELRRQGKMPRGWYVATGLHDAAIPQWVRNGYHAWAIPAVKHMRRKPESRFSRLLEKTFNWRSEDIAARHGVKGARPLLRGRLVTAAIAVPSIALGLVAKARDLGAELYGTEAAV